MKTDNIVSVFRKDDEADKADHRATSILPWYHPGEVVISEIKNLDLIPTQAFSVLR